LSRRRSSSSSADPDAADPTRPSPSVVVGSYERGDRAVTVHKLAELADNCDLSRIAAPTDDDRARAEKCHEAIELIEVVGRLAGGGAAATPAVDLPDKVQIRYERFERGYRELAAYVDAGGALVLDGCDAGDDVRRWSGDWDYEYTLTVPAAHRDRVLLQLVKEKVLSDDKASVHTFKEWLQAHNIESTFWSY
jgi:hypothetical protein